MKNTKNYNDYIFRVVPLKIYIVKINFTVAVKTESVMG